jgi:hypothetical protein
MELALEHPLDGVFDQAGQQGRVFDAQADQGQRFNGDAEVGAVRLGPFLDLPVGPIR